MPKQIDHAARRRQIAEAVCELIAERGIEAVTLRDVAAHAGVSMGAVQRAFPKQGMLDFALEHIIADARERGTRRIESSETPSSAKTLLTISLQEIASAGPDQRAQATVWLTFVAQAGAREQFASTIRANHEKVLDLLEWLIKYGQRTGEIRDDVDAREEAHTLQALTDGLTQHIVLGHAAPADALRLINRHTSGLWASPVRTNADRS